LADKGHEATALTSFPNYPFGKVYDGYKQRLCQRETVEGVQVVRVPMFPDHSRSSKRRALSYLSFGFSASILGAIFTKRPDLIWIHHPPLTTGIAGYILAKLKRVPFVYEIHDLWPETLVSTGMIQEGRITRAIRKVCGFLHRRAAAIVVTSPGMKTHLERQNVDPEKIHVIPQWADEDAFFSADQELEFGLEHGFIGRRTVVFAGNLGIAQGLDTVLDAAHQLTDLPDFQFVLIGDGVEGERLKARCVDEGLTNVRFLGQKTPSEVSEYLSWADGALIHLKEDPLFAITIPSKTQAYMACGVPILCGVAGDGADAIDDAGCGFIFQPEDASGLANATRELLALSEEERENLGANALAYFMGHYHRGGIVSRYEALFAGILGHRAVATVEEVTERKAA
jgi:colanic acid biosynthesis glycosyl transferase WcaI